MAGSAPPFELNCRAWLDATRSFSFEQTGLLATVLVTRAAAGRPVDPLQVAQEGLGMTTSEFEALWTAELAKLGEDATLIREVRHG